MLRPEFVAIRTALFLALALTVSVGRMAWASGNEALEEKIARITRKANATVVKCKYVASPVSRKGGDAPLCETTFRDLHGDQQPVTVVNDEYALKIFQEMTVNGKIPFGFPEDGCFARAHEMSRELENDNPKVMTGKVFATGLFRLENDKAATGAVSWGFHVAPFFILDNGHGRHIWVIDPSLFYEPEPIEKWLTELTSGVKSELKEVFLTSRFIYHPDRRSKRLTDYNPKDVEDMKRVMKKYHKKEVERVEQKSPDL